ncbi:MAG TPA: hypothetical protein PLG47_04760 [Candidatus Dojkabacteria bacterium]|nr:hypothetical protein [Candidatus Dojkabacteria bacterium]
MLICNLITERYTQLRKEQFGITPCYDTLYSMFNQQLGLYLGCTGVVICYEEETCVGTTTTTCELATTQVIVVNSCNLTATQR